MSQDGKDLSVTLKAGTDYAAPWIVVYGNSPDEVAAKLNNMAGLIEATVNAANTLKAANNASPVLPQAEPTAPQPWGNVPAPKVFDQQAAPASTTAPQQQSGPAPVLHPSDTCQCGKRPEKKNSQGGKAKWQCPDWRWNNGNPNGHYMEWINSK